MDCENCPFNKGTKVQGEGPDECDLVVVAMAPADEEVQQGRVLVGPSGKMLRGVFSQ